MQNTFIYGLIDPRDGRIRYIGKANNPEKRILEHLHSKRLGRKRNWIELLRRSGLQPRLLYLVRVSKDKWQKAEQFQIALFRGRGMADLNLDDGGAGGIEFKHPPRSDEWRRKQSIAHKGVVYSEEYKRKMSERTKGRKFTQAHKKHLSDSAKGNTNGLGRIYVHTAQTREKLSEARRRRPSPSLETRKKLSEASKGRRHSEETLCKMIEARSRRELITEETRRRMSGSAKRRWHR